MKTLSIDPEILAFAAAVREALNDLAADEVEDLTDGLEADLSEQAADGGGAPVDPTAYAAELRAAAGLAPRAESRRGPGAELDLMRAQLHRAWDGAARVIQSKPFLRAIVDLLGAMRPVWWAARGLLLFGLVTSGWLMSSFSRIPWGIWIVAAAFVVVSVQWGRGRWLPTRGRRAIPIIASILAVLVIMPLWQAVLTYTTRQFEQVYSGEGFEPTGLQLEGQLVDNIFAYGADGELLTDVQLFDQNGAPLNIESPSRGESFHESYSENEYIYLTPRDSAPGVAGWNVFPLQMFDPEFFDEYDAPSVNNPTLEATPPFLRTRPLVGSTPPTNAPVTPDDK
jgi:hypothetical protein